MCLSFSFLVCNLNRHCSYGLEHLSVKPFKWFYIYHCVTIFQFQIPLGYAAILPIHQQWGLSNCVVTNLKGSRPWLNLIALATIALTMDKVWIGASKIKSSVQSRVKIETKCQKSCREDECCGFYRFYNKFKQCKS